MPRVTSASTSQHTILSAIVFFSVSLNLHLPISNCYALSLKAKARRPRTPLSAATQLAESSFRSQHLISKKNVRKMHEKVDVRNSACKVCMRWLANKSLECTCVDLIGRFCIVQNNSSMQLNIQLQYSCPLSHHQDIFFTPGCE